MSAERVALILGAPSASGPGCRPTRSACDELELAFYCRRCAERSSPRDGEGGPEFEPPSHEPSIEAQPRSIPMLPWVTFGGSVAGGSCLQFRISPTSK